MLVVGLAVLPAVAVGAAHAEAGAAQPVVEATPYADQVAVGPATKIGNPAGRHAGTATPTGALVLETDSRENARAADSVAVLGTKLAARTTTLADTGPSRVATEALVAAALIALGAALRGGPAMWDAATGSAAERR